MHEGTKFATDRKTLTNVKTAKLEDSLRHQYDIELMVVS